MAARLTRGDRAGRFQQRGRDPASATKGGAPSGLTLGKFDVDLGEQLGVQQERAGATRWLWSIRSACTRRRGCASGTGRLTARAAACRPFGSSAPLPAAALELGVQEAEVETGIVRDQRGILEELDSSSAFRKTRLIRQEKVERPCTSCASIAHVPLRVNSNESAARSQPGHRSRRSRSRPCDHREAG